MSARFEIHRQLDTLRAIHPLLTELALDRPGATALAREVARLTPSFMARYLDAESWPRLEWAGLEHLEAARATGSGPVIVPAHFGGYLWTSIALLQAGVPVSLLVDARNRQQLDADHLARVLPLFRARGTFDAHGLDAFETIDSEAPTSLWRLSKAVAGGRAAVMFIDGNSGIDGRLSAKGSVRASMFGRDIWARPGIAALAQSAKAQIVPLRTSYDAALNVARFECLPPLQPDPALGRKQTRTQLMVELFAWLESEARARPHQWEEWWLLPKWWVEPPAAADPLAHHIAPASLQLPALVGRRLTPSSSRLWRVEVEGKALIIDVEGEPLCDDPQLVELFSAAERTPSLLAWFREQDDTELAKRNLCRAAQLGLITF